MCAFHIQETLKLQKQLQQSAKKISNLQKQLELANQRWNDAFYIMNNEAEGNVDHKFCNNTVK
jgi:hypothetical protein